MANTRNLQIAGTTDIETITFDNQEVDKVVYNGVTVWENAPITPYGYITYNDENGEEAVYTVTNAAEMQALGADTPFQTDPREIILDNLTLQSSQITKFAFTQLGANVKVTAFLAGCTNLTVVEGTEMLSRVGTGFCANCTSLDCPITYPGSFAQAGTTERDGINFLYGCTSFNSTLTIANSATYIGRSFLEKCSSFNQPLAFPNNLTTIGEWFLNYCTAFNQPLTIPSKVTAVYTDFLRSCTSFNSDISLPTGLTDGLAGFLRYCTSFNQPITIPSKFTAIPSSFLAWCSSFNQPITIPSTITKIGDSFLRGASSFNQSLVVPTSVTQIGNYFLSGCSVFAKPLTLPSAITTIGTDFLDEAKAFTGPLTVESAATPPTDIYTLSTGTSTAPLYATGVTMQGSQASTWKTALPNRTTSPYRKLL